MGSGTPDPTCPWCQRDQQEQKEAKRLKAQKGFAMQNIKMSVVKNILTITVDLSKKLGPSASGKSVLIASTEGNAKVPGHEAIQIGLNVYTKNAQQK